MKNVGIIAAIVALVGIGFWIFQCINGLQVTGMHDTGSWGLYITCFMFFVGLSAGGLIISSAPKALGLKGFDKIAKVAVLTSIACTVAAIAFVIVDLGSPQKIYQLLIAGNFTSPLMWDLCILTLYLVLSIVYLVWLCKADESEAWAKKIKVMAIVAFIVAILVHSVTAWIFSMNGARAFWNTSLMAPWFVASALVSGTALVVLVIIALAKAGVLEFEEGTVPKLVKLLGIFVAVDLFFLFCEVLTGAYAGAGSSFDAIALITGGAVAPFFWIEVLLGVLVMVVAFAPKLRAGKAWAVLAAVAAIVGVFCKRAQIIEAGFGTPNINLPGVATGPSAAGADGIFTAAGSGLVYLPTGLEYVVALGVVALAVAVFAFVFPKVKE